MDRKEEGRRKKTEWKLKTLRSSALLLLGCWGEVELIKVCTFPLRRSPPTFPSDEALWRISTGRRHHLFYYSAKTFQQLSTIFLKNLIKPVKIWTVLPRQVFSRDKEKAHSIWLFFSFPFLRRQILLMCLYRGAKAVPGFFTRFASEGGRSPLREMGERKSPFFILILLNSRSIRSKKEFI